MSWSIEKCHTHARTHITRAFSIIAYRHTSPMTKCYTHATTLILARVDLWHALAHTSTFHKTKLSRGCTFETSAICQKIIVPPAPLSRYGFPPAETPSRSLNQARAGSNFLEPGHNEADDIKQQKQQELCVYT